MRSTNYPPRDAPVPGDDDQAGAIVRTSPRVRPVWLLVIGATLAALVGAALWYGYARPPTAPEAEGRRPAAAEVEAPQPLAPTEAEDRQQLADLRAEIAEAESELQAADDEARKVAAEYQEFRRRNPEESLTPADRQARQPLYEAMIQYDRALAAYKEVRERNDPRIDAILERHPDWR